MSNNIHHDPASRREDWETPQWLFDYLNKDCNFNFAVDLAATEQNRKCTEYVDMNADFLRPTLYDMEDWHWCNPPYKKRGANMAKWAKALMAVPKVVVLVPASVGTKWFQPFWDNSRFIVFLRKRLYFETNGKAHPCGAPFDSALIIRGWSPLTGDAPPDVYKLKAIGNVVDASCTMGFDATLNEGDK